ncbi:hypothetical protein HF673_02730 [Acidithiobacillus thiooxidans]|uniref:hypothetical protein n=1 Tax=Acidithiobacillus thiooxidans TaxID=930 RepID=UPI001C068DEB|nr:hypothetical protein [Acidithiobacillus thiooxidans]MBU2834723.1 hypothetical protein [Acidithiobacillus thiooxidans]
MKNNQQLRSLYEDFGMGCSALSHRRVFFDMRQVTSAFTGVSDPRDIKRMAELKDIYGRGWLVKWLKERLSKDTKFGI